MNSPQTGLRDIEVDFEALEDAFENNAAEVHSYLHLGTGQVLRLVDGVADAALRQRVSADTNYLRVEPVHSREQYRWLERFIEVVESPEMRARLQAAIDGKGAFRRFKDVLMSTTVEREAWYAFRRERLHGLMQSWLESHGFHAVPRPPVELSGEQGPLTSTVDTEFDSVRSLASGLVRKHKSPELLRAQIVQVLEQLGGRELDQLLAFSEFLKARRAARAFAAHFDNQQSEIGLRAEGDTETEDSDAHTRELEVPTGA